jgi:glycosyltransferase 2 family protein
MTQPPTSMARDAVKSSAVRPAIQKHWRWLPGVLGLALAWHASRGVAWAGVWDLVAGLGSWAVLILVVINLLLLPLMTARWWLLLRTLGWPVGMLSACAYRAAANAVSYLTPGPHFGGEPLSVDCLHHRHGVPLPTAAASVAVDRLLELLASMVVLTFCLISLDFARSRPVTGSRGLLLAIVLLAAVSWFLAALFSGRRPLGRSVALFKRFDSGHCTWISCNLGALMDMVTQAEAVAESVFRRHRGPFLLANLLSLVHWTGVFAEFWLMSALLGLPLSFWHLTAVVAVARLSFFTPLPAGIGVLESALPWVTAALGLGSPLGMSLCLIMRCRDLLFGLAGLGLAMQYLTCRRKARIIDDEPHRKGMDTHG